MTICRLILIWIRIIPAINPTAVLWIEWRGRIIFGFTSKSCAAGPGREGTSGDC